VVDAREHLVNRLVRCELEREWAKELRPGSTGQLDAVAGLAAEAIE
jgi:hypothetical protein